MKFESQRCFFFFFLEKRVPKVGTIGQMILMEVVELRVVVGTTQLSHLPRGALKSDL